ncbi:MAG: LuxR C-terminal-related transcriptional regulator [Coleofasciculus sp. S288]|nr:LuxR C-terminal-related transcriptional regulator [Coleofasciculus sp. S288]
MFILAPELNSHIKPTATLNYFEKPMQGAGVQQAKQQFLLQAIIEGFVDGVLILTERGEWVHANERAHYVCQQMSQCTSKSNYVPEDIWSVCEALIDSREFFLDRKVIIESEINTNDSIVYRIRARWLVLDESAHPYLLVTIEDRQQSSQNIAIAEAKKYGLTPREAEVWLLRRANHSYKEIADKLYITLNTVKKHMKNIYAKQQELFGFEESGEVTSCEYQQAC